jgi:hypothetical protein
MNRNLQNKADSLYVGTEGITVDIAPGTRLNGTGQPSEEEKYRPEPKCFPNEVYRNLPELHRLLCDKVTDKTEKEVLLFGLLGVVSGMLPNVNGYYGGKEFRPNLYVYLIGPYGEGKSGLNWARKIAEGIHLEKHEKARELRRGYKEDLALYKRNLKQFEQGKLTKSPEEPTPPPHLKHFLPANNGKTGLIQLLKENNGCGTIFETEADTLTGAIKQEHGNFSDTLRQGFGQESISYYRRSYDEDVEILSPALSVVLSSTFDQLLRLIPSIENGLFSRFIYYEISATTEFKDVFDSSKNSYNAFFTEVGKRFKVLYDYLSNQSISILFRLQAHQEAEFIRYFQQLKLELCEDISTDLGGTVNRLALICFRIAMQLSVYRAYEVGLPPLLLECSDQDFENALRIINTLQKHTVSVYDRLSNATKRSVDFNGDKDALKLEQKRKCFELYKSGITNYREIAHIVLGSETKVSTVHRWINGQ